MKRLDYRVQAQGYSDCAQLHLEIQGGGGGGGGEEASRILMSKSK